MEIDNAAKKAVFKIENAEKTIKLPKRMQWSKAFDDFLACLVSKEKNKNWREIAIIMSQKFPEVKFTSKKCRARWKNCINPEISKFYLNDAEELLLIAYHFSYKNKWSKISKHLPRRHSNILRNSFYGAMRKLIQQIIKEKKMPEEATPLLFLQSLYISIFIMELLNLPEVPENKNPLVPLYIYMHVKEKKINKEMCEEYIMQLRARLLASNKKDPSIQALKNYSYLDLTGPFFLRLAEDIKQTVTSHSCITNHFISSLIGQSLISTSKAYPLLNSTANLMVAQFPLQPKAPTILMPPYGQVFNQAYIQGYYQVQVTPIFPTFPQYRPPSFTGIRPMNF